VASHRVLTFDHAPAEPDDFLCLYVSFRDGFQ
jgi:hypothetical protein